MRRDVADYIDPAVLALVAESREFYERRPPGRGPTNANELLELRAAAPPPSECAPPPSIETVRADGRCTTVRIHVPADGRRPRGVLLEIHTGGFYSGSAAASDVRNRRLVDALNVAVVSVDYRLAPENPWPAAPDDCEAAALWLIEHAAARFGTSRLGMMGFSAGSTLVLATLVRLRDRGVRAFDGAVVECGTYDLSATTPAGRLIADEYFLQAYAGDAPDRTVPDLSPIFARLQSLPPILMVIGEDDVLLEDNLAMADRLAAAGGDVEVRVYPASPHAFSRHPTAMARAAADGIDEWIQSRILAPS
ncbi:alpha/beta hydrolase [Gordonia hydrophobica]|uniref:Alpha/beta hydrolase n=1 Tax=Gordonia hydrophobica TaxID=40516 RepID=A0ABZ2TYF6_9ACTN|nr:alpha/beta hydrolase [Gordonia hydrophobica]MBM7366367.1 acetyl esterase/lipase [Gordonia hydrophobica]